MGEWTAIVLAGRRPGENGFAASHGVAAKALIRAGGEPMLGRVARTLLDSPSIGRIVVLAQQGESLLTGELEWMAADPRIATAESGDGISASVGRLAVDGVHGSLPQVLDTSVRSGGRGRDLRFAVAA